MNTSTPSNQARKPRYGVMAARIGSSHMIKNPDGVVRQFKVRDRSRHPSAKCVVVCFECNKKYTNVEEMMADHPEDHILRKQQEKHVFALWSEDPIEKGGDDKKKADYTKVLGLLSTEE